MIAELHGKISNSGSNLKETLEDNLTGNVFGSLRYIPFSKGIKNILLRVIEDNNFDQHEIEEWAERIEFWPYHKEGELDLIINLNLVIIAIEVKYNSGLSSDDEIANIDKSLEKSRNQLARESRIVKELAVEKGKKPILLFIAKQNEGKEIVNNIENRNIIEEGVELKFISWEDICLILEELYKRRGLSYFEEIIIKDIYNLLVKKGFNSFKDFKSNINDIEVVKDEYYLFKVTEDINSNINNYINNFKFISNIEIGEDRYYEFI